MVAESAPRKYAYIDALRGIAFLGVLFYHISEALTPRSGMPKFLFALLAGGDRAVPLFFLLSALTLFLSLDARRDEERPDRNFFIRRFFRIAPLYYAATAFYLLAFPGYQNDLNSSFPPVVTPGSVLSNLTFTHGWWPYWINQVVPGGWSIAVEMNFYWFVPLLHRRIRRLDTALAAALVANLIGVACTLAGAPAYQRLLGPGTSPVVANGFVYFWLPNQMSTFFLGFVLYFCLKERVIREDDEVGDGPGRVRARMASYFMLTLAAYLYLYLSRFYAGPLTMLLTGLCCLLFTWSLALVPHRLFVNRATCFLGRLSYSGYLTHFALLRWSLALLDSGSLPLARERWPVRLAFLSTVPLLATVAVSYLTHRFIELPGMAVGKRIIAWSERRSRHNPPANGAGPAYLRSRSEATPLVTPATVNS